MPITSGTRLGPYEILAPLGAGGMGEVYRARDTRLDRCVAIKVLPAHLSQNPHLHHRFEREARALSSLQHPHICTLHDIGCENGIDFLVMEYLEGETLAARLEKGPLPTEQVLRIGLEITDALDKAHRQGVIHRDLKPGNIILTKTGAKLLDFGLAKASTNVIAGALSELSASPTQSKPLTAEGTILGTLHYMAPEQLEGKEADARSDIFALGAVFYEMTTGRKAFPGKNQASIIAAILSSHPPAMTVLQPLTPAALDRVVKTCLAKDPDERWQTAHDLKLQLQWIAEAGSEAGVPAPVVARRRLRERLTWVALAVTFLAGAAGLAGTLYYRSQARLAARPLRAQILPPEKAVFDMVPIGAPVAVSPDGQRIVFGARDSSGKRLLWVRSLDALTAQPLAGTEGATYPFWSPDSRHIGFFADGKLRRIEASGGPVLSLSDAPDGRGGTWNREDVIVFAPAISEGLYRVAAPGGAPTPVTKLVKGITTHRWPQFLPDGRHFLYTGQAPLGAGVEGTGIHVGSLDSTETRRLLPDLSNAAYAPPGYLLFWRQVHLMAQPFDAKKLKLTGDAFPVAEQVQFVAGFSIAVFSVSQNGVLVYQSGGAVTTLQLHWLDSSGKVMASGGAPAGYTMFRLSPDGQRLAAAIIDVRTGNTDLWLDDLGRNVRTRFTFAPGLSWFPVWSPDSKRIAFASNRKSLSELYVKPASGVANEELVLEGQGIARPMDWSPDGRFIAYQLNDGRGETNWDMWILPLSGDRKPFPFLATAFNELGAVFSPNGRWMAYQSDESGSKYEVYVAPFPGPGAKFQVSTGGGRLPTWSTDGKQLFYLSPDDKLMAVDVKLGPSDLQLATPRPLFARVAIGALLGARTYDVAPGARRFLVLDVGEAASEPLTVVANWPAELKRK